MYKKLLRYRNIIQDETNDENDNSVAKVSYNSSSI